MEKGRNIQLVLHNGREWILILYSAGEILKQLKKQPGARYSATYSGWLIPDTEPNRNLCRQLVCRQRENTAKNESPPVRQPETAKKPVLLKRDAVNEAHFQRYRQELILKAYSANTQRTYLNELNCFLQWCQHRDAKEITMDGLRLYFEGMITQGYSVNLVHSRLNAVKFLYEKILCGPGFWIELPRPKKGWQLPGFFSAGEIAAILNHTENLKHKTMLAVCYGSGLRVSELVHIKVNHVYGDRRCILVRSGKGNKDRLVPLSAVVLVLLREYYRRYRPQFTGYLFPGQVPGEAYSVRSVQLVLQAAKQRAGVFRPGAVHALRHSFATHLVDKGTDVSMIQKLLGHNDIRTTLRYLHTSHKDLLSIISPIEHISINLPKQITEK